jgi:hypothetical protein
MMKDIQRLSKVYSLHNNFPKNAKFLRDNLSHLETYPRNPILVHLYRYDDGIFKIIRLIGIT